MCFPHAGGGTSNPSRYLSIRNTTNEQRAMENVLPMNRCQWSGSLSMTNYATGGATIAPSTAPNKMLCMVPPKASAMAGATLTSGTNVGYHPRSRHRS